LPLSNKEKIVKTHNEFINQKAKRLVQLIDMALDRNLGKEI